MQAHSPPESKRPRVPKEETVHTSSCTPAEPAVRTVWSEGAGAEETARKMSSENQDGHFLNTKTGVQEARPAKFRDHLDTKDAQAELTRWTGAYPGRGGPALRGPSASLGKMHPV